MNRGQVIIKSFVRFNSDCFLSWRKSKGEVNFFFFLHQWFTCTQWNFMRNLLPFMFPHSSSSDRTKWATDAGLGKVSRKSLFQKWLHFKNHLYIPSHLINTLTNVKHVSHDVYASYSFGYLYFYNFHNNNIFISHQNLCG